MEHRIWYIYQNGQQTGPFDIGQIKQLYTSSMMTHDAYLFKVGWKDWTPVESCLGEIGVEGASALPALPQIIDRKRLNAPRATVKGRIDFHNNTRLISGVGVNISSTGIFL